MLTTLIGTLLGGAFRIIPEVLKWLDRRDDRSHELAMMDKQLEADKMLADQRMALARAEAEKIITVQDMTNLMAGVEVQGQLTGIKWVDAINSLMRPIITFWWVIIMYSAALVAQFLSLTAEGASQVAAILTLWGPDEKAIVASIISFWFVDRSLRKK